MSDNSTWVIDLGTAIQREEKLKQAHRQAVEALRALLTAVTFGPMTQLSPDNLGYEARVPAQFAADARAALAAVDEASR